MNRVADLPSRGPFSVTGDRQRNIPVLNSSVPAADANRGDPMDVTTAAPDGDSSMHNANGDNQSHLNASGGGQTIGAAAAAQQPKVVQTAFIHKLYK
jgi:hypothetical protein